MKGTGAITDLMSIRPSMLIPDHIPTMANDRRIGTAYTIGYMKAWLHNVTAATAT